MYAIIEVAGKQYKVTKGLKLFVDKLNVKENEKVSIDKVLLIRSQDTKIGMPYIEGASVEAVVKDPESKDKKIIVFKYKNKTGYHKKQGHRQKYTVLEIKDILAEGKAKKVTKAESVSDVASSADAVSAAEPVAKKPDVKKVQKETIEKKPVSKPAAKGATKTAAKPAVKKTTKK